MATLEHAFLRGQLEERRQRLQAAIGGSKAATSFTKLLDDVDLALERMDKGTYGLCEACHDSIEKDRLIADPLVRYCLDHLTPAQQRALQEDLDLASQMQHALLPPKEMLLPDWKVYYHFEPAGPVSGDYCDVIRPGDGAGDFFFLLGDVSGKGVAASMLMTHLHAMFRSLTRVDMPLDQLMGLANRLFCESTMAGHFATLVCGRAGRSGRLEISSAGHLPSLLVRKGEVLRIEATGMPLGMFCSGQYAVKQVTLEPGDSLFLYTDGVSEMRDASGAEYGIERLARFVKHGHTLSPDALTANCLHDLKTFSAGAAKTDDLTIMVVQRGN